jgi:hypothetical protein
MTTRMSEAAARTKNASGIRPLGIAGFTTGAYRFWIAHGRAPRRDPASSVSHHRGTHSPWHGRFKIDKMG